MPSTTTENLLADESALTRAVCAHVVHTLGSALALGRQALLLVSGGHTPIPVFKALSDIGIDWSEVSVSLADERWVVTSDPDSNEALVRRLLLQNRAKDAHFVGLKNDAVSPQAGWPQCEAALNTLPWPADLLVLGMGDDGHTASLFPGAPELSDALAAESRKAIAITPPHAPHARMSLTRHALLNTREILVHIQGDAKWAAYQKAKADGPIEEYPIRCVLHQDKVPTYVYWSP